MELSENKSQIWYLVLSSDWKSVSGEEDARENSREEKSSDGKNGSVNSNENWKQYLPVEERKGKWKISDDEEGIRLVSNPLKEYKKGRKVFVVEIKGQPVREERGEIWMRELKIVREATPVDIKELGLYFGQE